MAAGKAAKAANQVEQTALSPLVVALAADEIKMHEFDIPVMGRETAAKAANVGVQVYKYEEKGVQHVYGMTGEDKRQGTGTWQPAW